MEIAGKGFESQWKVNMLASFPSSETPGSFLFVSAQMPPTERQPSLFLSKVMVLVLLVIF